MEKIEKLKKLEKEIVSEISEKIIRGILLTPEEFEIAKKNDLYDKRMSYKMLELTHYKSPNREGWLCVDSKTGKIRSGKTNEKKNPDGSTSYEMCVWGIHREDVDVKYLTEEQKKKLW